MFTVIQNGINPILNQYDYPEVVVKIGIDEGENVIVQYGHDKRSSIDILGYCTSIAAKITSITDPNGITMREDGIQRQESLSASHQLQQGQHCFHQGEEVESSA
jgi:class 3 adenylate cyclase